MPINFDHHYCSQCRNKVEDIHELLFVEDTLAKGFCSEPCILNFYEPLISQLHKEELRLRASLNIPLNESLDLDKESVQMKYEQTRQYPDEIRLVQNGTEQEFYIYVKEFHEDGKVYYYVMICFSLDGKPSVVLAHFMTLNYELVQHYLIGEDATLEDSVIDEDESIDDDLMKKDISLDSSHTERIELIKSELLAQIITLDIDDDIDETEYFLYEQYIELTLEEPEEKFGCTDIEDDLFLFVRSFQDGAMGIFYLVFTLKITLKGYENSEVYVPVLSIPTNSAELLEHFKDQSEVLVQKLTN